MEPREIGRLIKHLLMSSNEVKDIIGSKIYPYPANEKATFPFVVYIMDGIVPHYTKDRADFQDDVTVDIIIWAQSYDEKITLANACHKALQGKRGIFEGFKVSQIRRIDESEEFIDPAYGQTIIYEIQLDNF